jgi:hypothetical protein
MVAAQPLVFTEFAFSALPPHLVRGGIRAAARAEVTNRTVARNGGSDLHPWKIGTKLKQQGSHAEKFKITPLIELSFVVSLSNPQEIDRSRHLKRSSQLFGYNA